MATNYNVMVVTPTPGTATSNTYDYTQVFDLENALVSLGYARNINLLCVTSENFLSKTVNINNTNQIQGLSAQEFSQANMELLRCSTIYRDAQFIAHSFVQTESSSFLSQFSRHLSQWSVMPDANLYPYATNLTNDPTKMNKIRNTANNFGAASGHLYQYSLSTHFQDSLTRSQLKGMYMGNYVVPAKDVLNLNILNSNYASNIASENTGPYYANGSFDILTAIEGIDYFSMIGQDAMFLWNLNRIAEYNEDILGWQKNSTTIPSPSTPLIIQTDLSGVTDSKGWTTATSVINASNFFTTLFSGCTTSGGTTNYPGTITFPSTFTPTPAQTILLNFLKVLPYILFVDADSSQLGIFYSYNSSTSQFSKNTVKGTAITPVQSSPSYLKGTSGAQYQTYTFSY